MTDVSEMAPRFWSKVAQGPDTKCWPWLGAKFKRSKGSGPYGRTWANGKGQLAHRVAFAKANGIWPKGVVRHTCNNPICCNPAHLIDGTYLENMADREASGRTKRGGTAAKAKLNEAQVRQIRTSTLSYREMRARYGVKDGTIHAIRSGRNWRHVQ